MCTVGISLVIQPGFLHPVLGLSNGGTRSGNETNVDNTASSVRTDINTYDRLTTTSAKEIFGYTLTGINGVFWCLAIAMNRRMTSSPDFRQYYVPYLFWHSSCGVLMSLVLSMVGDHGIHFEKLLNKHN